MSRFENVKTGVVVSVDDSKDDRYASGWKPVDTKAPSSKKASDKKSEK